MGKGKTKSTSNETVNMTTAVPQFMTDASKQVAQNVVELPKQTAYDGQMVAPQNQAQQQATAAAQAGSGQAQPFMKTASDLTNAAANGTQRMVNGGPRNVATTAQAAQQGTTTLGAAPQATATQQGVSRVGAAPQTQAATQGVSRVGAAPMSQAASQGVALAGSAPQMNAAQQRGAATVGAQGVNAVGDFDQAQADKYMSPYTANVQTRTLDEMMRRNAMEREGLGDQAMASKAYGGARDALLQSEMMKGQNANMQDYLASSNADAFSQAQQQFERDRANTTGVATGNADRRLSADTTSAGFLNQMMGANADRRQAANAANMDSSGRFSLADQAARNTAMGANADRSQQTGLANQEAEARYGLANQSAENTAMGANADRSQAAGLANMDTRAKYDFANQGAENAAAGANADRGQQAELANVDSRARYDMANASALNASAGANADRSQQTSQFNAGQANQMADADSGRELQASIANADNSQSMLDRMLQAGKTQADIGTASTDARNAEINAMMQTGGAQQATEQLGADKSYEDFLRLQQAPYGYVTTQSDALSGLPTDKNISGTTNNTTTAKKSGGLLGSALAAAQIAASFAPSDRRLKRSIERIGELANGLGLYLWRYVWDGPDAPVREGVMADEVARLAPWALGPKVAGYATVDYSKLDLRGA